MVSGLWAKSQKIFIFIFNVGRGLAIFIRTPFNHGIIYDMGGSDEFSPADFLQKNIVPHLDKYNEKKIAQVILSHPHADHIREIAAIKDGSPLAPALLTCPHDKETVPPEGVDWDRMQISEGASELLGQYRALYASRKPPLQTIQFDGVARTPNVEYGVYYVRPPVVARIIPKDDHEYGNGTSLVLYYRHGKNSILIPGDIGPEVFKHLLKEDNGSEKRATRFDGDYLKKHPGHHVTSSDQPSLACQLKSHGLSVLVAPHHGLKSCYSKELYECIAREKPSIIAISEIRHTAENHGKVDNRYQSAEGASGADAQVDGASPEKKYSVSTRNGQHILIKFVGTAPRPEIILETDPVRLLNYLD